MTPNKCHPLYPEVKVLTTTLMWYDLKKLTICDFCIPYNRLPPGAHVKPTQPNGVMHYAKRIEPLRWIVELETSPHVPQTTFSVNR